MHLQDSLPNWKDAVPLLPDYASVKGFSIGLLLDARAQWIAAGRDPAKLFLILRRYADRYPPWDGSMQWQDWVNYWTAWWAGTFDRTYLEQAAPYVLGIETLNEHMDERMVTDKALLAPHLLAEQAAIYVFEKRYRGKALPAEARLIIANQPEGNSLPREIMQLAVDTDNIVGYHSYIACEKGHRLAVEWPFVSGRWAYDEEQYGIRPKWALTECGPLHGGDGWRDGLCLAGDLGALARVHLEVFQLMAQTPAYRQGRILGPWSGFTTGNKGWATFVMDRDALVAVAEVFGKVWRIPMLDTDKLKQALADVQQLIATAQTVQADLLALQAAAHVWRAGDVAVAVANPLQLYDAPNGNPKGTPRPDVSYDIDVVGVSPDGAWLEVTPAGLWVRATDVKLKA